MGWEDQAISLSAPPAPPPAPNSDWSGQATQIPTPSITTASGILGAIQAGYQSSATGLAIRGKLPDVVLDPQHSKWYERLIASGSELVSELPEMIAGSLAGGAAGAAAGSAVPGVGTALGGLIGGGAGAFAVPAAIRESLMQAYSKGAVTSSADFLDRAAIVLKTTGKAGLVGAATAGIGSAAARITGKVIAPEIGMTLTPAEAATRIGAAETAGSYGAMVVAPAALEGKLPEPEDFANAAILLGGLKGAIAVGGQLRTIFAKAGVPPEQVLADAQQNPTLAKDLRGEPVTIEERLADPATRSVLADARDDIPLPETRALVDKALAGEKLDAPELKTMGGVLDSLMPRADVPPAYEPQRIASMLHEAVPVDELKVAEVLGNTEGEVPAEKVPNYPNFRYVDAPQDVQAIMARISEVFQQEIAARRGSKGWDASMEDARRAIAEWVGGNPESLQRGSLSLDAELLAKKAMLERAAGDVWEANKSIQAKGDAATDADYVKLILAVEQNAMVQANVQGNAAEVARALNVMKAARQSRDLAKNISDVAKRFGDDPQMLSKMLGEMEGDVTKTSKAARDLTTPPTFAQKVQEVWKAGLLSGTKTYMVKALGDTVNIVAQFPERALAAALGTLHGGEKVTPSEIAAWTFGMIHGTKVALARGAAAWNGTGPFEYRQAIGGTLGKIVSIPHRIMSSETETFRGWNEAAELAGLAHRQAVSEGLIPGQDRFNARVQELTQNPTKEIQAGVKLAGDQGTFMEKLGKLGQAFQALSRTTPGGFVLPFVLVPANLVKWGVRRMPLVAGLLDDVQADIKGGGAKRDLAIARQAIGGVLGYLAFEAVKSGALTGSGVSFTPEERRSKTAAGWQPYSLKIDGKWYSYNRFEPAAKVAMVAADLAEMFERSDSDDKASLPVLAAAMFGHATISETFLSGLNGFMQALTDPKEHGAQWAHQLVGSAVPAILAQTASSMDPNKRVVDTWVDALQSRLPGLREHLTAQVNPLTGKPVENNSGMTPVSISKASEDAVLTEAERLKVNVTHAPKTMEVLKGTAGKLAGKEGRIDLTAEERAAFDTAGGKLAHEILAKVVGSESWDSTPDAVQKMIFARVITQAHRYAAATTLTPDKRVAYIQQVTQKLQQELAQ